MVAMPSGGNPAGTQHSTVNFTPTAPSANTAIVPIGPDGSVAVYTTASTHVIVDVVGYITDLTFLPEPVSLADQLALRPGETVSDVLGYSVIAWADAAKTATVPSDAEYAVIRVNSYPNTVAFHPTGERSLSPSSIVSGTAPSM